ncbi:MAG: hypothetical protein F6K58_02385 [Symploca sp. SIO2E9]|nr:hypothetical protein [Symploca sp. SIO2E9]
MLAIVSVFGAEVPDVTQVQSTLMKTQQWKDYLNDVLGEYLMLNWDCSASPH